MNNNFNSVFKTLNNHTAQLNRNGFDLSQRVIFNSPAGALLPFFSRELSPGDSVDVSTENFIRTQPLNSAAFARLTQHVEYFFVPLHQLWSYFDQFITGVQDLHSVQNGTSTSLSANQCPTTLPYLDLKKCVNGLDPTRNDTFGYSRAKNMRRLLPLLGYGDYDGVAASTASLSSLPVNPFRLMAYQKIFNDYYRLSDFEESDPWSFNCDYINPFAPSVNYDLKNANPYWERLFRLHYRAYKKDYFTAIKPSAQYTPAAISSINSYIGVQPQFGDSHSVDSLSDKDQNNSTFFKANNNTTTNQSSISVASIRNAFALDRLCRITTQAGKNFRDQMRAHYGINTKDYRDHSVMFLGSQSQPIQIGEVVSTANTASPTGGSALGRIAGQGSSAMQANDGHIRYTASENGILMGIYSIVPEADYCSNFPIDKFNRKFVPADYYKPEFDELGYQPLYQSEIMTAKSYRDVQLNSAIAWQPRYMEYKTCADRVCGEMARTLKIWSIPRNLDDSVYDNISSLYINPNITNTISALNYNPDETADLFICNSLVHCIKMSSMGVSGLPNL